MKRALVIGGTGPTGPKVVQGLLERGYEVTIYHRGYHETDALPAVHHHLHGDPDSREDLERDFGASEWDLVCSMYGRLRYVADLMAGRCERFIGIGGIAGNVAPDLLPFPQGRALPVGEDHPRYRERLAGREIGWTVAETERRVMAHHAAGDYAATLFRYTGLYGPREPRQWLWPLVRRVLEGRRQVIVPGDGNLVRPICFTENASHQILLAIDRKEAAGQVFNSIDQKTFFLNDILRLVAEELHHEWEIVPISHPLAEDLAAGYAGASSLLDAAKLTYVLGYWDLVPPEEGIRRTVRWLVEHRDEVDEEQLATLVPNPYAYDLEDKLIASYKVWQEEVTTTIPRPEVRSALSANFRRLYQPRTNA
ncbi:MAG: NAD-dependent epimerase/dehydratase family protein [Chloroflexi bacterium]|nr:NAD-dependent epimerase/dehydratase family protein [Chloroflexota bacterium]